MSTLRPARLSARDVLRTGASGLRARPARVVLSALGIAIGIATMVAVVGLSTSSKADLMARLDRLGTDLLTVEAGQSADGVTARLPANADAMVRRIGPVTQATATAALNTAVRRSDIVPEDLAAGVTVQAARLGLKDAVGGRMRAGAWLNAATERYPTAVLGAVAAERLGRPAPASRIRVGERWFTVLGTLEPIELIPELDRAVLVGFPAARAHLRFDGRPTTVYERSPDASVHAVRGVLARTVNPENPESVKISRPSDALAAKAAADRGLTSLMLGLGAVALLVGGVGVANTMVISVLERRQEIGLRRSLGATRGHIRMQFLTESLLLSALGGATGAVLGGVATAAFALAQGWTPVIPLWAFGGAVAATVLIGAVAGLYPAVRASRLHPTVALNTA
ncbi:ABC transporter permease [Spirillospora sp. NPDC050679]